MTIISDNKLPEIVYGVLGPTYVYENERELTSIEYDGDGEHMIEKIVTRYEYDYRIVNETGRTYESVLNALKNDVLNDIADYDGSINVNEFIFNGISMWLDKETRVGLKLRFDSEKESGLQYTTLWYGIDSYTIPLELGISLLPKVELYASQCYDNTAKHKKHVSDLSSIKDVFNYDYKTGYPEKLNF